MDTTRLPNLMAYLDSVTAVVENADSVRVSLLTAESMDSADKWMAAAVRYCLVAIKLMAYAINHPESWPEIDALFVKVGCPAHTTPLVEGFLNGRTTQVNTRRGRVSTLCTVTALGLLIENSLAAQGLTKIRASQISGINLGMLTKICYRKRYRPRPFTITRLADLLKVSEDAIKGALCED